MPIMKEVHPKTGVPKVSVNDFVEIDGVRKRFKDWCESYKIHYAVAQRRVNVNGMDWEEAITTPPMTASQRGRNNSKNSYWRNH